MSAALRVPAIAISAGAEPAWHAERGTGTDGPAPVPKLASPTPPGDKQALHTFAFYRKHTHTLLRRYLYASMLVGRTPAMLQEPLIRGFASHRRSETFEDCVIFVLDVENALARLSALDRLLITRIAIQEYSFAETALLLNKRERVISSRFVEATDHLTEILLERGTLTIPHQRHSAENSRHDG